MNEINKLINTKQGLSIILINLDNSVPNNINELLVALFIKKIIEISNK